MASVAWTPAATLQLERIRAYIHQFDPVAALRVRNELRTAAASLADFPNRGRMGTRGRRELPSVPPYVIRYRVVGDIVVIQSVRHGARRPG